MTIQDWDVFGDEKGLTKTGQLAFAEAWAEVKYGKNKPDKCVVCSSEDIRTDPVYVCQNCTCFYDKNGSQI